MHGAASYERLSNGIPFKHEAIGFAKFYTDPMQLTRPSQYSAVHK